MSSKAVILNGCFLVVSLLFVHAEPVNILPDPLHQLQIKSSGPGAIETRIVSVSGNDFKEAIEAKTRQGTRWPYDNQLQASVPVEVKNGDVVLAEFSIRALASTSESGEAKTQMCFEQKGGEFVKSIVYDAGVGKSWKRFQIPFRVQGAKSGAYGPNEAQICFRLGYQGQTIQIGGIRFANYGPEQNIASLPATRLDYAGREPEAAWRIEAAKRIETLRKALLAVHVVDSSGNPVPGAAVYVQMKKSAFHFGSAVDLRYFSGKTPDALKYRQFVLDHFNQITPENDLKWNAWEWDSAQRGNVLQALGDLKANGMRIHGHCLIWPGFSRMPVDAEGLISNREALDKRIAGHFTEIMKLTQGMIDDWDVVNEPYAERDILDQYGDSLVGDWFALAHGIDPVPILYLNDYANFQNGGDDTAHKEDFESRIKKLLVEKIPVQGIGMQSHFGSVLCPPEAALKELDRFAKLGLPIQITEFDVDTEDEQLKSDFTRDFMTLCFSHPAVIGFSCWGFWEGKHWKPAAAMIRKDWSITPWGKIWLDLVENEWSTRASGTSNASGDYQIKGFLGDYIVIVKLGDKEVSAPLSLRKDSPVLQIQMDR